MLHSFLQFSNVVNQFDAT